MTEEEAKDKWCPIQKGNCLGYGCMMLRSNQTQQFKNQQQVIVIKTVYCGLAGKP